MGYAIRDIIGALEPPPAGGTVDGLLCGDAEREAAGVAVTFLLSHEAASKAAGLGCNLVISHEGIWYSHRDGRDALASDAVYRAKQRFIEENGLAVYRYHDGIHCARPDGVTEGLLHALGWRRHEIASLPAASVVELPAATAGQVARHIRDRLGLGSVRFAGDESAACRRVGVLAGYRGSGELAIPLARDMRLDLLVYGEGPEWETPEYVRDAAFQHKNLALVVLGHAESEIPGMELLARRLGERFPSLPVRFLRDDPVLRTI